MNNQRPLLFLLLLLYVFSPTIFNWIVNPNGAWFRPYIIWGILIIAAFFIQRRNKPNDIQP